MDASHGSLLTRIGRASIWAPGAIPKTEMKYGNLKRIWLPFYDVVAMWCALQAILHGSSLMNRLFSPETVDILGWLFMAVAWACFLGVAFPSLWALEWAGKIAFVGMIVGYIGMILVGGARGSENFFVVGVLTLGLPLALFRLDLLGREWRGRKMIEDVKKLLETGEIPTIGGGSP